MSAALNEEEIIRTLEEYSNYIHKIAFNTIKSSSALGVEDLYQIGEMAVLRAVRSYDPTCGKNIKSYICSCIRQDIYNEAARFLGIFTVDHRVTEIGAKIVRLDADGKTCKEITNILNDRYRNGNWTEERVYDTKLAYTRRASVDFEYEPEILEEINLKEFLLSLIYNDTERFILLNRILGNYSVSVVAADLQKTIGEIYAIESTLKQRIILAIKNIV